MKSLILAVRLLSTLQFIAGMFALCLAITLSTWMGRGPTLSPNYGVSFIRSIDAVPTLLYILGLSIIGVAVSGCAGVWHKSWGQIHCFGTFSVILTLLFIAGGVSVLTVPPPVTFNSEMYSQATNDSSQQTVLMDYLVTDLWNNIGSAGRTRVQDYCTCCGLTTPADRAEDSAACPISRTPDFINVTTTQGCMSVIETYTGKKGENLAISSFSVALVTLMSAVSAFMLFRRMKHAEKYSDSYE